MSIRTNALLLAVIALHAGSIAASSEQTPASTPAATIEIPTVDYSAHLHSHARYRACGQMFASYVKAVIVKPYPAINSTQIGIPDLHAFHAIQEHSACNPIRDNDGQAGQRKLIKNAQAYALEQVNRETTAGYDYDYTSSKGFEWKRTARELHALQQDN